MIYVLVEVSVREFESRKHLSLLLKNKLKEEHTILIGNKFILIDLMLLGLLKPGIIVDKCGTYFSNWRYKLLSRRGFQFVVLDEEGIFTNEDSMKGRIPEDTYFYLANNKKHYSIANKIRGSHKNLFLTGNPRIELNYINESCKSLREDIDILFIGNYDKDYSINHEVSNIKQIENQNSNREFALMLMKSLEFYNGNIVYKPHPADSLDILNEIPKHIKYTMNEQIQKLIFRSKIVITSNCTSALEAINMNKILVTFGVPDRVYAVMNQIGYRVKSGKELQEIVEKIDNIKPKRNAKIEKIKNSYLTNINCSNNICEIINKLTLDSNFNNLKLKFPFIQLALINFCALVLGLLYILVYRKNGIHIFYKYKYGIKIEKV